MHVDVNESVVKYLGDVTAMEDGSNKEPGRNCSICLTKITAITPSFLPKGFYLKENAMINIKGGPLSDGIAEKVWLKTFGALPEFLKKLTSANAVAHGVCEYDKARIITQKKLCLFEAGQFTPPALPEHGDLPLVARDNVYFKFTHGFTLMMFDYDPPKLGKPLTDDELLARLYKACPGMKSAPHLIMQSASSFIYHGEVEFIGQRGRRIYVLVEDGTDIPRAGDAIFKRLQLLGHGYILVDTTGKKHERGLIDKSVYQGSRLDFPCAHLIKPLEQRRPEMLVFNVDAEALNTKEAIPDLTEEQEDQHLDLVAALKGDKSPKAASSGKPSSKVRVDAQEAPAQARHVTSPLAGALEMARRSFSVMPVKAGEKAPPLVPGWQDISTSDEVKIMAMAAQYPDCNWGVDCGKSGIGVLDEDVKPGKTGRETIALLEEEHGRLPRTPIVQTPSGGRHFYYAGRIGSTVERLGPGVDTRGDGGYVLAPGSVVDGKDYFLIDEAPIAKTPAWLRAQAPPRESDLAVAQDPVIQLDLESTVDWARHHLATTKPAIQGEGGDHRTYVTARALKDRGISKGLGFELMHEIFNPRCVPRWSYGALKTKVESAYKNSRNEAPGALNPLAMFPEDMSQDPFAVLVGRPLPTGPCRGGLMEEQERKRSRTVNGAPCLLTLTDIEDMTFNLNPPIDGLVDECESLLILGANGAGKSLLSFDLALTLALPPKDGLLWGRFKIAKPLKTLVVQSEVTCKGLKNRNRKMCPPGSPEAIAAAEMIRVASYGQSGRVTGDFMTPDFRKTLLGWINDFKPDVIIVDPLSSFHAQNENDSAEMRRTLDQLTAVCDEAGGLIHILVHHVGENSAGKGVFKGRGASSIGDWAANIVMLEEVKGGDSLQMTHLKARNFEKGRPIFFDRGPHLRLAPRAELATEGIDALLHDILMEMGGEAASKSILVQRVRDAKGVGKTKGTDIVNDALARGVLTMGTGKGVAISILWKGSAADFFDDHEEVIGPDME